ncbi:MAG: GNAT family N-acetyltransferase [Thermoplasmata archaeon]|nr:GNAT family N-acetyltransferase [Thermoplasmata archaeon]
MNGLKSVTIAVSRDYVCAKPRRLSTKTSLWDNSMNDKRFPELSTERLELCEITSSHVDWYFEHFNTPEIIAGQGFPGPSNLEAAKEELDRYIVGLFKEGGGFRWGIRLMGESEIIGSAGFYSWDKENAKADMGYELRPPYWGKGIMKEALERIVTFGFEEMGLNRIKVTIMSNNPRSMGLIEKVGFRREGIMKDYSKFEGEYTDEHFFAMLKRDWLAKREGI